MAKQRRWIWILLVCIFAFFGASCSSCVTKKDTVKPVITLLGDMPSVAKEEVMVHLPSATVSDNKDGDITSQLTIKVEALNENGELIETVLEEQGGEACSFMPSLSHRKYRITYFVSDEAGNTARKQLTIKMEPKSLGAGDLEWDIFD